MLPKIRCNDKPNTSVIRLGKDNFPSEFLEGFPNNQVSQFDEMYWMIWRTPTISPSNNDDNKQIKPNNKVSLQRIEGLVAILLDEFGLQWHKFLKHHFITSQQFDYIKNIKENANEENVIIIQMDFSENPNLFHQNEAMQAHWTTAQAAIFTAHIKVSKNKHHNIAIVSDYLSHNVKFVHAAQGIIVDYILSIYPAVKQLNYLSNGAGQHFKNNKSILNLTYHRDFGIPASWTFSSTADGKGPMDGIGAAIKYRATRKVLSEKAEDAVLIPEALFKFRQQDTTIDAFYLETTTINQNYNRFKLEHRWKNGKVEGTLHTICKWYLF